MRGFHPILSIYIDSIMKYSFWSLGITNLFVLYAMYFTHLFILFVHVKIKESFQLGYNMLIYRELMNNMVLLILLSLRKAKGFICYFQDYGIISLGRQHANL